MLSIIIFIVASAVFYFYFRVKSTRAQSEIEQKWQRSKANMSLGAFLIFFALNQLVMRSESTTVIVVSIVFFVLGAINVILGFRNYKHFLPLLEEEINEK